MQRFLIATVCNEKIGLAGAILGAVAGLAIGGKISYNEIVTSRKQPKVTDEIPYAFIITSASTIVGACAGFLSGFLPLVCLPIALVSVTAVCKANAARSNCCKIK